MNCSLQQIGMHTETETSIDVLKHWIESAAVTRPPAPVEKGPELTPAQLQDLRELEHQFHDIFSREPGLIWCSSTSVNHWSCHPSMALLCAPESCHQAMEVAQLLCKGITEESTSPWSRPILVVHKPNRSLHLCNDFLEAERGL